MINIDRGLRETLSYVYILLIRKYWMENKITKLRGTSARAFLIEILLHK